MSRNGTLLPIPEGSELADQIDAWITLWPDHYQACAYPRSVWLREVEQTLAFAFPAASSADRKLTARHYAPFYLKDGPNVP